MNKTPERSLLNTAALPLFWCSGCGNGIVLNAMLCAFDELNLHAKDLLVVSGIGCWGKADDYIKSNALHVTHGRALSFATGAKAANPKLHVIVLMGDGDGTTIGGNHLIHTARRNMDLTAIIVNNFNYGMTGGQYSATTPANALTSTSIAGNPERSFDLARLLVAAGANYVARETVASGVLLKNRIKKAISKKGFSVVEAISPCTTLYGPRNNMRQALGMLNDLKEKGIPLAKFKDDEHIEALGFFATGEFADNSADDFSTRYEAVRQIIMTRKGGGNG